MPASDLTIEQPANPADGVASAAPFFAVSLLKITVLSICTLGIYEFYWFYRNWQLIKTREAPDISPFWRTFFAPLYCYQCFSRIRDGGPANGIPASLAAGPLAAAWIIATLTWRLPDPYWLISFFAFVFILPVQAYANQVNQVAAPQHDPNSRFSRWNWVGVAVGGLVLVLAVIGSFMPAQ